MKLDRKNLIKRCDKLRQTIARYEGAKKKGDVWLNTCVSCGQVVACDKANGGHFVSRSCYPLRWDKKNVHCQCVHCNLYKNGAYIEYSQWFIARYGQQTFEEYVELYKEWQSGKVRALRIDEIRNIYDDLLEEGRELEERVGRQLFPKTWSKICLEFIEQAPKK